MVKFIPSLHQGLVYVAIGNVLGATLTGLFWLILASIQDPYSYGIVNHSIAVASITSVASLLGLNVTVTKYLARGQDKILFRANQIALISGVGLALIVSVFDWLLGLFVIGMSLWMMSAYGLLGKMNYKEYAIVVIGARATQLALSIILYYYTGIQGIIIGFVISFFLFSYRYLISARKFDFSFIYEINEIKPMIRFTMHAYSYTMSNAFLMYFDKIIIYPLFGYAMLGYYQIGLQFLLFLGMIPISFFQYLLSEESQGRNLTNVRLAGLFVSFGLAILLFVFSPWIIKEFFPPFQNSVRVVQIMSIGIIPMMIASVLNSRFFSSGRTRHVLGGSAVFIGIQMLLIFLLGTKIGLDGLALALVVALTGQALFLYISDNVDKKSSPCVDKPP